MMQAYNFTRQMSIHYIHLSYALQTFRPRPCSVMQTDETGLDWKNTSSSKPEQPGEIFNVW